ncbi:MAG: hypothetical protein D6714_06730 [Bacteroidetes bacterium]|nr:MAG: hypothetical protein D6714_06730 [Bacteroidota bacterium]
MYNFLTKNGQVVAFGLGLVLSLLFYAVASSGLEAFNAIPEKEQPASPEGNIFLFGIYAAVALVALCILALLAFGIYQMITNPKEAVKGIIGVVILAVIFGIAYATSSDEISSTWNTEDVITPAISKYVGASIRTTGILIGISILAFIASEIRNFFK